jgi:hypothetical protein
LVGLPDQISTNVDPLATPSAHGANPAASPGRPEDEIRDAFISHASEDKLAVAEPLVERLKQLGHSVWFDEYELVVGDALSESIDRGLARSRFGVVILSNAFFGKRWTRRELQGLVAKEMIDGERVILPVWHEIDTVDVVHFSPPLADVLAARTSEGLDTVAERISRAIDVRGQRPASSGPRPPRPAAGPPSPDMPRGATRAISKPPSNAAPSSARFATSRGSLASSPRGWPGLKGRRAPFAALGILLAALAGFAFTPAVHRAGGDTPLSNSASNAAMTVSFPANWRRSSSPRAMAALKLTEPIELVSNSKAELLIGGGTTRSPTLLPPNIRSVLSVSTRRENVRLGDVTFYRYRALPLEESTNAMTIYALPTTAGVLIGLCTQPQSIAFAAGSACERIIGSLRLTSAKPLALGPQAGYATELSKVLFELDGARARGEVQLAHAKTASMQALAAGQLAQAHEQAAGALRKAGPGPAEAATNAELVATLTRIGNGYAKIGAGAHSESSNTFDRGRDVVRDATPEFAKVLGKLATFGYRIGGR